MLYFYLLYFGKCKLENSEPIITVKHVPSNIVEGGHLIFVVAKHKKMSCFA